MSMLYNGLFVLLNNTEQIFNACAILEIRFSPGILKLPKLASELADMTAVEIEKEHQLFEQLLLVA